jgi:hypothetical protein
MVSIAKCHAEMKTVMLSGAVRAAKRASLRSRSIPLGGTLCSRSGNAAANFIFATNPQPESSQPERPAPGRSATINLKGLARFG